VWIGDYRLRTGTAKVEERVRKGKLIREMSAWVLLLLLLLLLSLLLYFCICLPQLFITSIS